MFESSIISLQQSLSLSPSTNLLSIERSSNSDINLQYELYSRYMQMSKQQIAVQELLLMKDSQTFLESLASLAKLEPGKDASSTMDSFSYDEDFENSLVQEFSSIQPRSPKKLTRKGTRHSCLKPTGRVNQQFSQILHEIQRNCSQRTLNVVKNLLNEHKKNLSKIIEIEKKQKSMKKIQENMEKAEQDSLIYKAKMSELEERIKGKDQEIKQLKEKMNQLKVIDKENMRSPSKALAQLSVVSSATKSSSFLTEQSQLTSQIHCKPTNLSSSFIYSYLTTKQQSINSRYQKIQSIELKIQSVIQKAITNPSQSQEGCQKCCTMIKKIKESVMKYRGYLEEQTEESEKMYNMLRTQVQNCLKEKKQLTGSNIMFD